MGWFSRKSQTGPIWDHLVMMTPERSAALLDVKVKTATDSASFLGQMIFNILQTCSGSFLKSSGEFARDNLGKVNADVIAFEALAFCTYLVRESHMPTRHDWEDDDADDDEILVNAYRFAISAMPFLVNKLSGWGVEDLWERRILYWFTRKDMRDATEAFVGTLLTMKDATIPAHGYGQISLDAQLNIELRAHVYSFSNTIPKAMADAIQDAIVEFGLLD